MRFFGITTLATAALFTITSAPLAAAGQVSGYQQVGQCLKELGWLSSKLYRDSLALDITDPPRPVSVDTPPELWNDIEDAIWRSRKYINAKMRDIADVSGLSKPNADQSTEKTIKILYNYREFFGNLLRQIRALDGRELKSDRVLYSIRFFQPLIGELGPAIHYFGEAISEVIWRTSPPDAESIRDALARFDAVSIETIEAYRIDIR
ncbi:hypothetical protein TWF730_006528 [Orbilia blumenaviensis]|uniref:Uncharacterized protein n=1 Tax=Orbilia blumenaviensis TaxID=1796055 RepID=A0AAV9VGX0_9PEZI